MTRQIRYSPEVRARAVRMVFEPRGEHASEWAAMSRHRALLHRSRSSRGRQRPRPCSRPPTLLSIPRPPDQSVARTEENPPLAGGSCLQVH